MPVKPPELHGSELAAHILAEADILYTDLDGTLLGVGGSLLVDGDGHPSSETAEAVAALNGARLEAVAVSGRNRVQTGEISRVLGWRGFIAELGSVIVSDRGAQPEYFLGDWEAADPDPALTPYEVIEHSGALAALSSAFPGRIEEHAPYHQDREATHVLRGNVDVARSAAVLAEIQPPIEIVDNGIIHPLGTGLVGVDEVHAYHLIPRGVTKHGAVARDLIRRGRALSEAIAVGDSATDVRMAESVALMVLVANALDDERTMREAARYDNVVVTRGRRGTGWAELARAWIAAAGGG